MPCTSGRLKNGCVPRRQSVRRESRRQSQREAFGKLDSIVYFNTTLNTGHAQGRAKETTHPAGAGRDEEPQPTTQESMFNYVRLSDGGQRRHEGPRSEVETVCAIAERVLGDQNPIDWQSMSSHRKIRAAIAAVIPGYGEVGKIDDSGREFQVAGRTIHEPRFATPSGRAKFHVIALPSLNPPFGLPPWSPSPPLVRGEARPPSLIRRGLGVVTSNS